VNTQKLFFLTNDDGFDAVGLQALATLLRSRHTSFFISAPLAEQSGTSHAITLHRPLRMKKIAEGVVINGTPTDAVFIGMNGTDKPHMLISGINRGGNLGNDLIYSGTVAAAHEGFSFDIPSLAVSLCPGGRFPDDEERWFARAAELLIDTIIPYIENREEHSSAPFLYNVNIPLATLMKGKTPEIRYATLGKRLYGGGVEKRRDPRGREYIWIGGDQMSFADIPGSDCNFIQEGFITITLGKS